MAISPAMLVCEPSTEFVRARPLALDERTAEEMSWLQRFSAACGPGYLAGITVDRWLCLLSENRFAVSPRYLPRAAAISALSVANSLVAGWRCNREAGGNVAPVEPPLFILGHWRSGTSHLHNLLASDERLIAPKLFQVVFPRTFRATEAKLPWPLRGLMPSTRRVDKMPFSLNAPEEDERALCTLCGRSPYLSMVFPRREREYDRYLTLRDVSDEDRREWQSALLAFVRRLAGGSGRTPVLKSPPHTCRIRLLLELFPGARFVHIHRHPLEVYQSTRHLLAGWHRRHALQNRDLSLLGERVIRQYREMYEAFFEERAMVAGGRLHELAFTDLERDPKAAMRALYGALGLPAFDVAEPAIERYLASVAGYRKNEYGELPRAIRERIRKEWSREFEEWGYGEEC